MARAKVDWTVLRGALGVFALCAAVAAAILAASFLFREQMYKRFQSSQARFADASQRYLSVDEEDHMIRENYPRFIELYNEGIIGHENRLNWIEVLRNAGRAIGMPELRYNISSQTMDTPPFLGNTGSYQIYTSTMRLEMGLLHEYDFSSLLDDLDKHAAGLFSVSTCSFTRAPKIKFNIHAKNISASCKLMWYTINLPGDGIVMK